jgi:hypothetical protein
VKFNIFPYKLTGNPDPSGWVSVHDFTPLNPELVNKKGRLITVASMAGPEIGKMIFTRLHEIYFNTKDGNSLDHLSKSIEETAKEFTSPNSALQIISVVILNDKILFAGIGKVQAWVLRKGQLARIIKSGNSVVVAAGELANNDLFYIGTDSFFDKITPEILKNPALLKSEDIKPSGNLGVIILKAEQTAISRPVEIDPLPAPSLHELPHKISPIRLAVASAIDKIINILPKQKLFVKEDLGEIKSNKKRKIATSAGAILLFLLIVSIFFGVRQQKISTSQSKYAGILSRVQHDLDEAQSLSVINPSQARSLVLDANNEIQGLVSQKIKDDKVTKLAQAVANAMGQIAGLYNTPPNMYLDLSLQTSGFKGDDMASSDNRMVVLDRKGKRLISIDIDTSKTATVAGPDIMPNANYVSAYSDRNFVTAADGVWSVGDKAEPVIKSEWGSDILPFAYTGNFYILDKANGIIWRYQGDGGTFGPKANWFGAGIKPNLSNIISWTIDGNIWMLTSENKILRFSGGNPIDFGLVDLDKPLQAVDIATSQDSKYLYILDSGNGRILVINKDDGSTKAQYVSDNIRNAKKIVVSEASNKIILLEGDKLYSLDMKHLN